MEADLSRISACACERIRPKEIFKSKSGKTIIDFGQNLVGTVQVKSVSVPRDTHVRFRHAKVMSTVNSVPDHFARQKQRIFSSHLDMK